MAHLSWSPEALRDLDDVCAMIGRTSEAYARAFAAEVRAVAESIPALPRLGSVVPEYDRDDIRERQVRSFRIIYRVRDEAAEIIAFVNVNRRLPRTPPG